MTNFTAISFTWQWLTKYIFPQLMKIPKLPKKCVQSCIFLTLLLFQTYMSAIKKNHHLA